ncbi:hypothetical protein GQ457_11G022790 [Hibiscus cannabinus]
MVNNTEDIKTLQDTVARHELILTSLQKHAEEQKRWNENTSRTLQDLARQMNAISVYLGIDESREVLAQQESTDAMTYKMFDKMSTPNEASSNTIGVMENHVKDRTYLVFGGDMLVPLTEGESIRNDAEDINAKLQTQLIEVPNASTKKISKISGSLTLPKPFFELLCKEDVSLVIPRVVVTGCEFGSVQIRPDGKFGHEYSRMFTNGHKRVEDDDPYRFRLLLMDIYIILFRWNYENCDNMCNSKGVGKLESQNGFPKMVNDGVIMAKEDELEDSVEDIEVKLVRQLVPKTIDLFGDGMTTLIVLVQGLITKGVTGDRLVWLLGFSGVCRPGFLTTLMRVRGAVLVFLKNQETFARGFGYCEQNDILSPHVMVNASLLYSAWLRSSKEVDAKTRKMFIEGAVKLVANPSIIFIYEQTSMLDTKAATIIVRMIKNILETGRIIVCTIHQPIIDILEAFDERFLLKHGAQEIYMRPFRHHSKHLIKYFGVIQEVRNIREGYSPTTWMLEVTTSAHELSLGVDMQDLENVTGSMYVSSREQKSNVKEISVEAAATNQPAERRTLETLTDFVTTVLLGTFILEP